MAGRLGVALLAVYVGGVVAVGCLATPMPAQAPSAAQPFAQAPPVRPCECLAALTAHAAPAPPTAQPTQPGGQTIGGSILGGVATIGGALTGAPIAWSLGVQLVHLLLGTATSAVRRRRNPTA